MKADIKIVIAKNIADLRLANGMTQLELAERINYSDKAVSKWERAESMPDIAVLTEIADLFQVSLDDLVRLKKPIEKASVSPEASEQRKKRNRAFITGMGILLVWFIAALAFAVMDMLPEEIPFHWLSFVYAIPVSMIIWLIFNSIWFNKHRNFLIISFLMWSILSCVFLTALLFGINIWQMFILGIPGQLMILFWSKLNFKRNKTNP